MPTLGAVLIAKNEERNLGPCLESLRFCDETVVVDSGSADRTREIARQAGVKFFENEFRDFASQKNFAISKAGAEWLLLIDADERVTPELAAEVRKAVASGSHDGYWVRRENVIFGRRLRHGAHRGDWQLRVVRRRKAAFEGVIHERVRTEGRWGRLKQPLRHLSTPSVSSYMGKLNQYTSLEAQALASRGVRPGRRSMLLRPIAVYGRRAFWEAAFLDGFEGMLFAFLSAYYEFIRLAKCWERREKAAS